MGTNFTEPIVIAKLMWIHDEGAAHAMGVGGLGLHTHARTHTVRIRSPLRRAMRPQSGSSALTQQHHAVNAPDNQGQFIHTAVFRPQYVNYKKNCLDFYMKHVTSRAQYQQEWSSSINKIQTIYNFEEDCIFIKHLEMCLISINCRQYIKYL